MLKLWEKSDHQSRIDSFFAAAASTGGFNERFAKYRSERIRNAVAGLTGKAIDPELALEATARELGAKRGTEIGAVKATDDTQGKKRSAESEAASEQEEAQEAAADADEGASAAAKRKKQAKKPAGRRTTRGRKSSKGG